MNRQERRWARRPSLKKLSSQTIVITGATSGIGLATARKAARERANLVLVARSEEALSRLAEELRGNGARVITVAVDVGDENEMRRVEQAAMEQFSGFDTWINNAAVSMYGSLLEVPIEDEHQVFETNYWGMVHGSRIAAKHLRNRGGAIINVASTNADTAAPLQGTYTASQHAIKGYTDALRMELEAEGAPVSVTLVKPGPINTPFAQHARVHMDKAPQLTPPVYAPEVAAEAILFCAEHPRRSITVGGGGKLFAMASRIAPRMTDKVMSSLGWRAQRTELPAEQAKRGDSLYSPADDLQEQGDYAGHVMKSSLYTRAALRPGRTGALILASGVAAGLLWRSYRKNGARRQAHSFAERGGKAAHRIAKVGESLEHQLERKGRKAAKRIPRLARSIRRNVEHNLPHR